MIICERSGVLNLGAEGFVLVGAMSGAGVLISIGDLPLFAMVIAGLSGSLFGILFGFLVTILRVNQVIAGLIMVFLAQGLTSLLSRNMDWVNKPFAGLSDLNAGILSEIPIIGPIVFQQDVLVHLTLLFYLVAFYFLYRTSIGLQLRAVGENPEAVDAAGGDVILI